MPDRTRYALTPSQRENLAILLEAGAIGRDKGVSIFDHPSAIHLNPGVIGILIDKRLADKRGASRGGRGGSRVTLYWLTEAGEAKARELAAADG